MAPNPAVDRLRSDAEDVETELAQLAADGGPLRRELARIAGRLVATEAWAELGFARLGDYGRECGFPLGSFSKRTHFRAARE